MTELAEGLREVSLDRLRESKENPRSISEEAFERLRRDLQRDPRMRKARPLIATPAGEVVCGNMRLRADRENGESKTWVFVAKLNAKERREWLLRDNNPYGDWEREELSALIGKHADAGGDVSVLGFSEAEVAGLLSGVEPKPRPKAEPIEPPEKPITQEGDIWTIGRHKLLCGDSTKAADVRRLMGKNHAAAVFMDPPFAIYGSSSGLSASVSDDKLVRPFFRAALEACQLATKLYAQVYVCCDWRSWPSWWEAAKGLNLEPKNLLVWDKGGSGLGSNWANTYEMIGYFAHVPPQRVMRTEGRVSGSIRSVLKPNIIRANRPHGEERLHNAAKPTDLIGVVLEASTEPSEIVVDPFAGSGSTLIAAEDSGRRCFTIEIDPAWCDVTVQRWERMTGKKAKRRKA